MASSELSGGTLMHCFQLAVLKLEGHWQFFSIMQGQTCWHGWNFYCFPCI